MEYEKTNKHAFKKEVTKQVFGTIAAAGVGIGGAVIGQILIPVPIIGGIVGGIVGGVIGRLSGTVVSGKVYDTVD